MAADWRGGGTRHFGDYRGVAPRDSRLRFSHSRTRDSSGVLPPRPASAGMGEGEGGDETECLTSVLARRPQ